MSASGRPRSRGRGQRTGYTTGATAAAAATAATLALIEGQLPAHVTCRLPNGQLATFAVVAGHCASSHAQAVVIKDAGDDPDVTHGAQLVATVQRITCDAAAPVQLTGGDGIGIVTRTGLGLALGSHAINPVPRRNIIANVQHVATPLLAQGQGVAVSLMVPDGERMAQHTLNARLGIHNGISILGTTGIVRPYSTAAFRASVVQAIHVAACQGHTTIVLTTGGRTEQAAQRWYPQLPEVCFVQMGDFIKAAVTAALRQRMTRIIVGAMIGKLTKMAQGLTVTHAWRAALDRQLLVAIAADCGAPADITAQIQQATTARFAAEALRAVGLELALHHMLAQRVWQVLRQQYPGNYQLQVLACDLDGNGLVSVGDE